MDERETGGPAFPFAHVFKEQAVFCDGMTLRDYFAAKALGGFAADHSLCGTCEEMAEWAYKFADAMLEARK